MYFTFPANWTGHALGKSYPFAEKQSVHSTLYFAYEEKARRELHKNLTSYIEQFVEATSHKTVTVRPPTSYL